MTVFSCSSFSIRLFPTAPLYSWCKSVRLFFFFSSRRRHTRCLSDWSSDALPIFQTGDALARDRRPAVRRHAYELASNQNLSVRLHRNRMHVVAGVGIKRGVQRAIGVDTGDMI